MQETTNKSHPQKSDSLLHRYPIATFCFAVIWVAVSITLGYRIGAPYLKQADQEKETTRILAESMVGSPWAPSDEGETATIASAVEKRPGRIDRYQAPDTREPRSVAASVTEPIHIAAAPDALQAEVRSLRTEVRELRAWTLAGCAISALSGIAVAILCCLTPVRRRRKQKTRMPETRAAMPVEQVVPVPARSRIANSRSLKPVPEPDPEPDSAESTVAEANRISVSFAVGASAS